MAGVSGKCERTSWPKLAVDDFIWLWSWSVASSDDGIILYNYGLVCVFGATSSWNRPSHWLPREFLDKLSNCWGLLRNRDSHFHVTRSMLVTGPKAVTDSAPPQKKKNKKKKTLQNLSRYDGPLLVTCHVGVIYVFVQYVGLIFSQCYGLRSPYGLRFSKSCVNFFIFIFWAEPVRCPESVRCFGPVRWPWASTMVPELVTSPSTIRKTMEGTCLH